MTKRQKIAISSLFLAVALAILPLFPEDLRIYLVFFIVLASYFLSVWAIYGQFSGVELLTLFVLPVILTASFGLFFSTFATDGMQRLVLALIYFAVMYTILLSSNIFNVSLERNIPLVRAARTIGYLATLFVSFAFFTLLFGLGLNVFVFATGAFLVSTLLFAQGLWQIELKQTDFKNLLFSSVAAGLVIGEIALAFGFWPLSAPKIGLAITVIVYVVLGVLSHQIRSDLTRRAMLEYLFVAFSLFVLLVVTTSWGI